MPSREPELYKDRIEVSLDGRQIFYLFFGGAVIVGIVFVLGVLVGRRVEARGHLDPAAMRSATDPLAALDRLEGRGGLSFQGALTGKNASSEVEKTIGEIEKARAAAAPVDQKTGKPEKPFESAPQGPAKDVDKQQIAPVDPKSGPVVKPGDVEKTEKGDNKPEKSSKKHEDTTPETKVDAKTEPKTEPKTESKDEARAKFTVQLSSFQDKAEADAFLASIKAAGFQAHLTQAEVDGKGTYYRVRLGTYRSLEAANDAKEDFEKASKKTASVMKL